MTHIKTKVPAKLLIPVQGNDVAPRFDMSSEAWIGWINSAGKVKNQEILVLPHPSAEGMCQLILSQNAEVVICGGIESEYFDYLEWKSIIVFDSVIATYARAVEAYAQGELTQGFTDITSHQAGAAS